MKAPGQTIRLRPTALLLAALIVGLILLMPFFAPSKHSGFSVVVSLDNKGTPRLCGFPLSNVTLRDWVFKIIHGSGGSVGVRVPSVNASLGQQTNLVEV